MLTNFLKKPFGFALSSFIVCLFLPVLLKVCNVPGLFVSCTEWLLPFIFIIFYILFIYKKSLSSLFKVKAALYLWMLTLMNFIIVSYLIKKLMWPTLFKDMDPNVAYIFNNFGIQDTLVIFYIMLILTSPISLAWNYLILSCGNKIGLWLLAEKNS